jgi:hypothetical protein
MKANFYVKEKITAQSGLDIGSAYGSRHESITGLGQPAEVCCGSFLLQRRAVPLFA